MQIIETTTGSSWPAAQELQTIISRSGTRHILRCAHDAGADPSVSVHAYCGFSVRPEDALADAIRDCEFCLRLTGRSATEEPGEIKGERDIKTKDELLNHYAARTPKRFLQFDGFYWPGDMCANKDGFAMCGGETWELMRGAPVRILIDPEADRSIVYELLKRFADDIPKGFLEAVDKPELPPFSDQQGVAELFETEQANEMTTE
jgi:hypothetical protein